jgi:hypothetical protein
VNPGQELDFRRFCSDALRELFREQKRIIRDADPQARVTTNFMGFFAGLDPWGWSTDVDVVANDVYRDPADPGGHVEVAFSAYPSLSGAVGTKNITLLATNGAKRSAMAPDVPAVAEFVPGFQFAPVIGVYARTGTPPAILEKIASEVAAIVKEPEIIKQFATAGIEPAGGGPKEYADALKAEDERVAKTVKAAGMTPQ